jgi:hypothetical protein
VAAHSRQSLDERERRRVKLRCSDYLALACCALVAACGGGDKQAPDSAVPAAVDTAPVASESPVATDSTLPCPRTGKWATCSFEKRLQQAGFVLRKAGGEPTVRSGLSVQPQAYTLGRAYLEVFIYPDESALKRDLDKLDTTVVAPRGGKNDWGMPPRFIRSGNLIAVFLTSNEQQAERLNLAVTAGAPQR